MLSHFTFTQPIHWCRKCLDQSSSFQLAGYEEIKKLYFFQQANSTFLMNFPEEARKISSMPAEALKRKLFLAPHPSVVRLFQYRKSTSDAPAISIFPSRSSRFLAQASMSKTLQAEKARRRWQLSGEALRARFPCSSSFACSPPEFVLRPLASTTVPVKLRMASSSGRR